MASLEYFRHDSRARRDKRLRLLRAKYGRNGVCIFWDIVEELAEDEDHRLPYNYDFLCTTLQCSSDEDKEALRFIIEQSGLISIDKKQDEIYSPRLDKHADYVSAKSNGASNETYNETDNGGYNERITEAQRNQRREAGRKSALKRWNKANNEPTSNETPITKPNETCNESITEGNESCNETYNGACNENITKVTEITEHNGGGNGEYNEKYNGGGDYRGGINTPLKIQNIKERGTFVPPSLSEVENFWKEKGFYATDPKSFFLYYESNGWMQANGNNKINAWRPAAEVWERNELKRLNSKERNELKTIAQWKQQRRPNSTAILDDYDKRQSVIEAMVAEQNKQTYQ